MVLPTHARVGALDADGLTNKAARMQQTGRKMRGIIVEARIVVNVTCALTVMTSG